ncbi:MAG: putative glucoronyl hydrolase [Herbinix sp.]|jgi:unsaturated chondroitin disaccharide hydrolase|nr:putative glucoronyl hydrolase [Herbinix sp.]
MELLQNCSILQLKRKDGIIAMLIENMPVITEEEVEQALRFATEQVVRNLPAFTHQFQKAYSEDNFYQPIENNDWTTGFWTGEIWLAYEYSRDERLKAAGEIQIESFLNRIENKIGVDHHDMGFLYSPSCIAGYKLTGNEMGKAAAVKAADQLITRYHPVGEFIQAWGAMDAPENYRLIIDCLLNLPLLYWAFEETGDTKYRDIADKHIHTAINNVIREDYSTWHTFFFDMKTGEPDHGSTCQGYRDGSAWARGQAWGIYGCALAYKYTKREEYIEIFRGVTQYFIDHLPKDLVPFWDLEFTDGDDQPRDSSSASIAVCGLLEMIKYMNQEDAASYKKLAMQIIKSVYQNYAVKDPKVSNGLVLHSTYSNHSPYNTCNHYGVDECNSWGDYFYMEALTRLQKDWVLYW